jgi:uncharacterized membrane protein
MRITRRAPRWLTLFALALFALAPAFAAAGPRSGASFGGRLGFRSGGGMSMPSSPGYSGGYGRSYGGGYYGGGSHFLFLPSFGGYGFGGGFGLFGTVLGLMVAGLVITSVMRAIRANRGMGEGDGAWGEQGQGQGDDNQVMAMPGRAHLYKLQLALGRSARGIRDRLADFATQGDTSTEAGLAALLQQTALELLREKDAVRYASAEARGPMSLTNAETAMNGVALAERSRFQVERLRVADGHVSRSVVAAEEGKEVLELVVVTLVAATRVPLERFATLSSDEDLAAVLTELGGVAPDGILGLEVIWTPADPDDSMTETDVMTTYPELRSL